MEITIKVTKILEPQGGVSSKNGEPWVKNSFVGETQGQYPKTLCFSVMGQERWDKMAIKVGGNFAVSFDPESREWNGKYFTDLSAWKAVTLPLSYARVKCVTLFYRPFSSCQAVE